MNEVTRVISALENGDPSAAGQLLPLVYDELRRLASQLLSREKPGNTLQATALVHEAYLRLIKGTSVSDAQQWSGRGHFFAAAAEAMRRILVESARRRLSRKHGGERTRIDLHDQLVVAPEVHEDLLALDAALEKLAATDRQAAELVQLRYFAGLTIPEAAEMLGISPRTADRLWAFARAWLHREIQGADSTTGDS